MTQSMGNWSKIGLASWLAIAGVLIASGKGVFAQSRIVPEQTLGAENSQVVPNAGGLPVEVIGGGAQRGANLFHSFREFNVDEGRGAYFVNPVGIENILGRVTGNSRSNILGTLGVLGNANLFLINPNGIIFGPNASLDVGGSFVATTANAVWLGDTGLFSASKPETSNLLSVKPSALFFNALATQEIVNRSTALGTVPGLLTLVGLQVPNGQSLLLVGGDVKLDGGILTAPGGRVELGGLASSGTVGLNVDGNHPRLSFPDGAARADVSLIDAVVNVVNLADGDSSSLAVNAQNINWVGSVLLSGSLNLNTLAENALLSRRLINLESVSSQAGVEINATDKITISGTSNIANPNFPSIPAFLSNIINLVGFRRSGILNFGAGDIVINTGSLDIDKGLIASTALLEGNSGNIQINAANSIFLSGGSLLGTSTLLGQGDSGDIILKAGETISFEGENGIPSGAVSVGGSLPSVLTGNSKAEGGAITIEARSLFLTNNAILTSGTVGQGDAGNITVRTSNSVSLDNSFISSSVGDPLSAGNGAEINIQTRMLSLTNGAEISSSTTGIGNAGKININASDSVNISGFSRSSVDLSILSFFGIDPSSLFGYKNDLPAGYSSGLLTSTETTASGRGGEIRVTTDALRIADGGVLSARTQNAANGGNIFVKVNTLEAIDGGQILTTAFSSGRAGNITVEATDSVTLSGTDPTYSARLAQFGQQIVDPTSPASGLFANTTEGSSGNGGSIFIDPQTVIVRDGASIAVNSQGTGAGGDITLQAGSLNLDNAAISAETVSNTGGNISLEIQDILLLLRESLITASAGTERSGGDGGNIDIDSQFLAATENSDITANAFEGNGGNINIDASGVFGLVQSDSPTDATSDITASSELGLEGTVEIDTPEVDPSRGLVELPTVPVATEVVQACAPGDADEQSEFIITGRGGLPPSPDEALSSDAVEVDWVSLDPSAADGNGETQFDSESQEVAESSDSSPPHQIVEAQGLAVDDNGEVWFVANAPTTPPGGSWQHSTSCHANESH